MKRIIKIEPLVSVIVPVYKAEKYIYQCIDSLLAQTYRNIEIILVDDGSPDRSGAICDEYAASDCRVKVIHQSNGGVSMARNAGMEYAHGEYTIHADPDDWAEPTMIEELVAKAIAEDADMVICDYIVEKLHKSYVVSQNPTDDDTKDIYCNQLIKKMLFQQLHGSCCNKLVRRACYNGVFFRPLYIGYLEDLLSNVRLLKRGVRICYLPRAFYHYRMANPSSICHTVNECNIRSKMDVIKIMKEELSIDDRDLFLLKRMVLCDLLEINRIDELKTLYPDITERIIKEGVTMNPFTPYRNWLYVAKRGHARLAHIMLLVNLKIIMWWSLIKHHLSL